MKIRIYNPENDSEKTIWIPTGFLFSRVGMYIGAKMMTSQSRKDYNKKLDNLWRSSDLDSMVSLEDVQNAEKLPPPITEEQARELFTALKNSRYLMGGLPLVSIDSTDGFRVRIDL